jgi:hypothetical protein
MTPPVVGGLLTAGLLLAAGAPLPTGPAEAPPPAGPAGDPPPTAAPPEIADEPTWPWAKDDVLDSNRTRTVARVTFDKLAIEKLLAAFRQQKRSFRVPAAAPTKSIDQPCERLFSLSCESA